MFEEMTGNSETPQALIALFQGCPPPSSMRFLDFKIALSVADLDLLHYITDRAELDRILHAASSVIGLERLILITTQPSDAIGSSAWVPLLRAMLVQQGLSAIEVEADSRYQIDLTDEAQVFSAARELIESLLSELVDSGFHPLVYLGGGPRAVSLGAMYACMVAKQSFQIPADRYDDWGAVLVGSLQPVTIDAF